ncbi:putative GDSL lipase/esterase, SGNH hydrolase superfamily [Helianthus annuus]|nr:putative GDSL lipase/esterase, SGNH hydrolase superfamily [Helianthus annuus]
MGARKFGILSIPPIGCCPFARFVSNGTCSNEINDLASACHNSFESLMKNMSSTLEGFKYSLVNTYNMTMTVITQQIGNHKFSFSLQMPTYSTSAISLVSRGFKDVVSACCADKTPFGLSECLKGVHLCKYRDDYLFWDAFHPTEKASKLAATVVVSSQDPAFVSPINFEKGLKRLLSASCAHYELNVSFPNKLHQILYVSIFKSSINKNSQL